MGKNYLNEVGTSFLLDCGVDLSDITAQSIYYQNPAGVEGTWSANLFSSYSELAQATGTYFVQRTLVATDFSVPGNWKFQAFVASATGTWWGEMAELTVYGLYQ
jgi:hypothetical protein